MSTARANNSYPGGQRIADQYIVERCLGRSDVSIVYKCYTEFDPSDFVVLKVLSPHIAADSVAMARFCKEFIASSRIVHPNVLRTYDFIHTEESAAFITEYAAGGDLADLLSKHEHLPVKRVLTIAEEICAGLNAIHTAKIIHRDLKPENVFFSGDGMVKIGDFGVAQFESGHKLTQHGAILGTIGYISPEYLQTGLVDSRSDIYAVGLILYEMITGILPFAEGGDSVERLMERVTKLPPEPTEIRADCPPELSAVIMRAIALQPDERFQSASDLQVTLADIRRHLSGSVRENTASEASPVCRIVLSAPDPIAEKAPPRTWKEEEPSVEIWEEEAEEEREETFVPLDSEEFPIEVCRPIESDVPPQTFSRRRTHPAVPLALVVGALVIGIAMTDFFQNHPDLFRAFLPSSSETIVAVANTTPEVKVPELSDEGSSSDAPDELSEPRNRLSLSPSEWQRSYIVESGDTLSKIAVRFDIPLQKLMTVNGIVNPDLIEVDTVLFIPEV